MLRIEPIYDGKQTALITYNVIDKNNIIIFTGSWEEYQRFLKIYHA